MNGLTGMITGLGRVSLLSGRIRLNGSDFASLHGARPLIHWAAATANWATQAARTVVGWAAPKIRPKSQFQIRDPFSFFKSIL
jgi:hypothetical protein